MVNQSPPGGHRARDRDWTTGSNRSPAVITSLPGKLPESVLKGATGVKWWVGEIPINPLNNDSEYPINSESFLDIVKEMSAEVTFVQMLHPPHVPEYMGNVISADDA